MESLSQSLQEGLKELDRRDVAKLQDSNVISDQLRDDVLKYSKQFKTSWIKLGQYLYSVWRDKYFHAWGYDKFEYYTDQEVGLKKQTCLKLLKSYNFIEDEEPGYLMDNFSQQREAPKVPGHEEIDLLRLAKNRKELKKEDFQKLKRSIFEDGKNAGAVRQDLTALMKERKPIDPEEEREKRSEMALQRMIAALENFHEDMETLKLVPHELIEKADELKECLAKQVGEKS